MSNKTLAAILLVSLLASTLGIIVDSDPLNSSGILVFLEFTLMTIIAFGLCTIGYSGALFLIRQSKKYFGE